MLNIAPKLQYSASSTEEIIDFISLHLKKQPELPILVGIDGLMGSGKTYLSKELATRMRASIIEVDKCLIDNCYMTEYARRIDTQKLLNALTQALKNSRLVFINGICLLDVMRSINTKLDLLIYIKKISPAGLWHDEFHLQDFIASGRQIQNDETGLHASEYEYHLNFQPHVYAALVYNRLESK